MAGLVCEGGAYRCSFTAGVLDALLDKKIFFKRVYGVSAGAANAVNYVSGQRGRNLEITRVNLAHRDTMSWKNFFKTRSIMDVEFVFRTVPKELIPFSLEQFFTSRSEMYIGVTNASTGRCEYFDRNRFDPDYRLVQASCSIPLLFPSVKLGDARYFDGGLADPIPLARALFDGNDKNLVILTRPRGFIRPQTKQDRTAARLLAPRYPKLASALKNRAQIYKAQTALCAKEEQNGSAVILAPLDLSDYSSFERSFEKQKSLYEEGYHAALTRLPEIAALTQTS